MIYRHGAVQYKATTRKIYTQVPSYYGGDGTEGRKDREKRGGARGRREKKGEGIK